MNDKKQELIDTLLAISVVAKRLATNLAKEEKKHGAYDGIGKRPECAYRCIAKVHITND